MKTITFKEFRNSRIAVKLVTQKEKDQFRDWLIANDYEYLAGTHYYLYEAHSTYFESFKDLLRHPTTFTIVDVDQLEGINQSFGKADLKAGYVVQTADGRLSMLLNLSNQSDLTLGYDGGAISSLDKYNNNLEEKGWPQFSIVKVYGYSGACGKAYEISTLHRKLLWERKPEVKATELTVEQIENKLGYKVKVVKG